MFSEKQWEHAHETYFKKKQESMDEIQPCEQLFTTCGMATGDPVIKVC